MGVILLILLLVLLGSVLVIEFNIFSIEKYKFDKYIFFIVGGILILLVATRTMDVGGPDYSVYYDDFYNRNQLFEYGYRALTILFKMIFGDFRSLVFFMAIIIVGGKLIYIYRYSQKMILVLLLYFTGNYLTLDFDVFRQGIALSIILVFSLKYLEKNENKKFYISVFIATLFHVSAIVFIMAKFIVKINFNKKIYIGILVSSYIIGYSGISKIILNLVANSKIPFISEKLSIYINTTGSSFNLNALVNLMLIIFILVLGINEEKKYQNIIKIYLFGVVLLTIFAALPIDRMFIYFDINKMLMIGLVYTKLIEKYSKYKIVWIAGVLGYTLLKFYICYIDPIKNFVI